MAAILFLTGTQATADDGHKAVGDNFFINTEWVHGSVGGRSSVASNGTDFLVVWRDRRAASTNGYDIYCARVTRNGVVLDPHGIGISVGPTYDPAPSNQYIPSVIFNGTNYYVFWVENKVQGDVQYQIYGARVTPDGTVLDPGGVQITSTVPDPIRMPGVAFDGTNFMIVFRTNGNVIRAMRVSQSLQSLDGATGFTITSPAYYPAVAFDGNNFLVSYHFGNSPWGTGATLVGKDGSIIKAPFTVSQEAMNHEHTSLASSGSGYLIAWYDWKPNNNASTGTIYAARVDTAGNVLDPSPIKVTEDARSQVWPEVAFDGRDYFVVWQQEAAPFHRAVDIHGRRISTAGVLGEQIGIATGNNTQFAPGLAYAAGRFLVVWQGQCGSEGTGFCGPDGDALEGQLIDKAQDPIPAPAVPDLAQESSSWVQIAGPFANSSPVMNSVWSSGNNDAYVAGERSFQRFNGSGWSEVSGPWNSQVNMFAVWGSSANDIWTTGLGSLVNHFNGSSWAFNAALSCCGASSYFGYGLWGTSPNNVWLVGSRGNAHQWNGTGWTAHFTPGATTMWSVWASSANDVYAVGDHGRIFHNDGSNWTAVANVPTSVTLNHIWGTRAGDIFAVGDFGTILHFDGTSWLRQPTGLSAHLYGVMGTTGSNVYAVGQHGTILRFDGSEWRIQNSGTTQDLSSLWTSGPGDSIFAAGGVVLRTSTPAAATMASNKSTLSVGAGFPGYALHGSVTLSVSGQTALQLASITTTGDFQQTNDCGSSVAVGSSCTITVQLTPQSFSNYSGSLRVISNAALSPLEIPLSGVGVDIVFNLTRPSRPLRNVPGQSAQATGVVTVRGPALPLQFICTVPGTSFTCAVDPKSAMTTSASQPITIKVLRPPRAVRLQAQAPTSVRLVARILAGDVVLEKVFTVPVGQ